MIVPHVNLLVITSLRPWIRPNYGTPFGSVNEQIAGPMQAGRILRGTGSVDLSCGE